MKPFALILDLIFLTAAMVLFASSIGLISIGENEQTMLTGIVSAFAIIYSVVEISKDIQEKPEKHKVKVTELKNPFIK